MAIGRGKKTLKVKELGNRQIENHQSDLPDLEGEIGRHLNSNGLVGRSRQIPKQFTTETRKAELGCIANSHGV